MTIEQLRQKLEALGYSYVVVEAEHMDHYVLTAIDTEGYQVEIEAVDEGDTGTAEQSPNITIVIDRRKGTKMWDIMFIGEEPFL